MILLQFRYFPIQSVDKSIIFVQFSPSNVDLAISSFVGQIEMSLKNARATVGLHALYLFIGNASEHEKIGPC